MKKSRSKKKIQMSKKINAITYRGSWHYIDEMRSSDTMLVTEQGMVISNPQALIDNGILVLYDENYQVIDNYSNCQSENISLSFEESEDDFFMRYPDDSYSQEELKALWEERGSKDILVYGTLRRGMTNSKYRMAYMTFDTPFRLHGFSMSGYGVPFAKLDSGKSIVVEPVEVVTQSGMTSIDALESGYKKHYVMVDNEVFKIYLSHDYGHYNTYSGIESGDFVLDRYKTKTYFIETFDYGMGIQLLPFRSYIEVNRDVFLALANDKNFCKKLIKKGNCYFINRA